MSGAHEQLSLLPIVAAGHWHCPLCHHISEPDSGPLDPHCPLTPLFNDWDLWCTDLCLCWKKEKKIVTLANSEKKYIEWYNLLHCNVLFVFWLNRQKYERHCYNGNFEKYIYIFNQNLFILFVNCDINDELMNCWICKIINFLVTQDINIKFYLKILFLKVKYF